MVKVFVTEPIHEEGLKLLARECEIVMGSDQESVFREAGDCDAILVRTYKITGDFLTKASKVKVVAKHGIGVDNIDVKVATDKGIVVLNAPESNIHSVAEHTLGMIMALTKNFLPADREMRCSGFKNRNAIIGTEIRGKTVGIIGLGKIGLLVAKKMQALDVQLIAYDPYAIPSVAKEIGIRLVEDIDEIYSKADVISVHVPLTKATEGMIGIHEFKKMKKNAYFINVSRGPIVREKDLVEALQSGLIKGAALDVFEHEPPLADNLLFALDNVLVSPHNAALTEEALIAMATQAAQGIVDFLNGKHPKYVVNPEVL